MTKRTNRQIIEAIKAEIQGAVEVIGYYDAEIIGNMLVERYNPSLIKQAVEEVEL